jgi:hypothetical protein
MWRGRGKEEEKVVVNVLLRTRCKLKQQQTWNLEL